MKKLIIMLLVFVVIGFTTTAFQSMNFTDTNSEMVLEDGGQWEMQPSVSTYPQFSEQEHAESGLADNLGWFYSLSFGQDTVFLYGPTCPPNPNAECSDCHSYHRDNNGIVWLDSDSHQ